MRYADLDGQIIHVYQAATHLNNETDNTADSVNSLLDKALGPEGFYGVFGARYDYTDQFAATILDSARARDVSLISAKQLLTWLDARNLASFQNPVINLRDSGFDFKFSIATFGEGSDNLYAMIPYEARGGHVTSIVVGGTTTGSATPVPFTVETIKGRSYAVFPAIGGNGNFIVTYT